MNKAKTPPPRSKPQTPRDYTGKSVATIEATPFTDTDKTTLIGSLPPTVTGSQHDALVAILGAATNPFGANIAIPKVRALFARGQVTPQK